VIALGSPLEPHETMSIDITDHVSISQSSAYAHIPYDMRKRVHRSGLTTRGKQIAYIGKNYVLLPAEVIWYPIPYTGYAPSEPGYTQRALTKYSLEVTTHDGMVPISQGKMTEKGNNTYLFEPETPLTQVSLTIGPYKKASVTVDSVEYSYYWIGKSPFDNSPITENDLEKAIRTLRKNLESKLCLTYPFKRYQIVETPVHFFGYHSPRALSGPYEQPEIQFIPESSFIFRRYTDGRKVSNGDKILAQRVFQELYITYTGSQGINSKIDPPPTITNLGGFWQFMVDPFVDYSHILTQFVVFSRGTVSTNDYFNLLAVSYFRTQFFVDPYSINSGPDFNYRRLDSASSQYLKTKSLQDIVGDGKYYTEYMDILTTAPETFFILLAARSGVDIALVESVLTQGFETTGADIPAELSKLCNTDVTALFNAFLQQKENAQYIVSKQTIARHLIGEHYLYNVRFTITNPTPYFGLAKSMIMTYPEKQDEQVIYLEPFSEKEVGMISEKEVTDYSFQYMPFKNSVFTTYLVKQWLSNASASSEPLNIPIMVETMKPEEIEFFDGVRTIRNGTVPPVIVLDNLDKGCHVISSKSQSVLKRFIEQRANLDKSIGFKNFHGLRDVPENWTLTKPSDDRPNDPFYGKLGSCYYTKAGDGLSAVEYPITIPQTGKYGVYLSAPFSTSVQGYMRNIYESGDLGVTTVKVFAGDGVHEETVDIGKSRGTEEWVYVGTYDFPDTTAVIQITDKSTAKIVIADAVQLRKVE
jgi:hypothetical protein